MSNASFCCADHSPCLWPQVGVNIVKAALRAPVRAIAKNAGEQGDVIIGKLLEKAVGQDKPTHGWNAQTGEYVDMLKVLTYIHTHNRFLISVMIQAGIIDPHKVVRTALLDASGVASLMLTTEGPLLFVCSYQFSFSLN